MGDANVPMKRFFITTGPTIADPGWHIISGEIPNEPIKEGEVGRQVFYYNTTPVVEACLKTEYDHGVYDGRNQGMNETLQDLGISFDTYIELMRAKRNGSVVSIYAKVTEPSEITGFEQDNEFLDGTVADPEYVSRLKSLPSTHCTKCGADLSVEPGHDTEHKGDSDVSY